MRMFVLVCAHVWHTVMLLMACCEARTQDDSVVYREAFNDVNKKEGELVEMTSSVKAASFGFPNTCNPV